jgi:hypothetical protein
MVYVSWAGFESEFKEKPAPEITGVTTSFITVGDGKLLTATIRGSAVHRQ